MKKKFSVFKISTILLWLKEDFFKTILRNASILMVGDTGASLINMVTLAIVIKLIGAEQYGFLVIIQSYSKVIDGIVNFQSWQAFIKFGYESKDLEDKTQYKSLIKQGTIIDLSTAIIGFSIAYTLSNLVGEYLGWDDNIIYLAKLYSFTILFHFSGIPTGILRVYNKFKCFSLQLLITSLIKLLAVGWAWMADLDLAAVIYIYIATEIIGNIILVLTAHYFLLKEGITRWWNTKIDYKSEFTSYSIWTNLSSTLTIPMKQLDVFIIASLISIEMVGVYKLFKQLSSILSRLITPIYQAIFPKFAETVANNKNKKAIKSAAKISLIMAIFIIPIAIISVLSSPIWLKIIYGEIFSTNYLYLALLIFYMCIETIASPLHPLFNALGYAKQKFYFSALVGAIYLISAWVFGQMFGLYGIIHAWGIQLLIMLSLKTWYIYKKFYYRGSRELLD